MDLKGDLQKIINDGAVAPVAPPTAPTNNSDAAADSQTVVQPNDAGQAYAAARAFAEVQATTDIATDPTRALQTKLNMKVAQHIDSSEKVAQKIDETADRLVDKGLKAQENKADAQITLSEDEKIEADFTKNKSEYLYHGIDHKVDKAWKRNLLLIINGFWFVIWAIVSCFTIVPVSTFLSRIKALKGIVKGCAVTVGILLLLAILCGITYAILRACGVNIFG